VPLLGFAGAESFFPFFPQNPPMPPPLCFGDAREGTVGDLSSRARRGTTPLAKRSVEYTTRIKHQALRSNQHVSSSRGKHLYLGLFFPLKRNPE